jgi:hypothetical protein
LAGLREISIFGEEPVTRVNSLSLGGKCRFDNARAVQIAKTRFGRADMMGFIRFADMNSISIGVRKNGDRPHSQPAGRAKDPHGNFTAICHQH